jgi:hypothetical protein
MFISQYQFSEKISLAGRLEYFNDPDQIIVQTTTPAGFQTCSATLTINYAPTPNSLIRLEGRSYHSSDKIFTAGETPHMNNYLLASSLTITF